MRHDEWPGLNPRESRATYLVCLDECEISVQRGLHDVGLAVEHTRLLG